MGMFDDVLCQRELPGVPEDLIWFQTKDFDCQMDTYAITDSGRLVKQLVEYQDVPEEKRPLYGTEGFNRPDSLSKLMGCIKRVPVGVKDMQFHGILNFYALGKDETKTWHEFNAKFTDGVMVEVVRVKSKRCREG